MGRLPFRPLPRILYTIVRRRQRQQGSLIQRFVSDAPADLPLDIADRYVVVAEIGRGGFAVVYRARDRVLERDVAIKILRADSLPPSALRRFSLELQVTARLEHPNILHVYDTGTWEGRPYYVMEYVRGQTLEGRLSAEGVLAIDDALGIASNVADALAFAHGSGVVHRDVKPANILLGPGGALLGDFGIAHVLGEGTLPAITSTGFAVGTMQYMSPEQLCAEPRIDARSDQYSLALVCYEMLTGVQPFVASTVEALRALRMVGSFAPASTHRPAVAAHADAALARALAPAPADRFRDVREFAQALVGVGTAERTALAGGYPASARAATTAGLGNRGADDGRATRRSQIRIGVGAVVLVALVGLGSASYLARRGASAPVADAAIPSVGVLAPRSAADSVFAGQVHDELNEWRDVSVLPPVQDDRRSLDALGVEGSRALAARLHAAVLLEPVTSSAGDSTRFTLAVFDGRSGRLEHLARLRPRGRALDGEGLRAVVMRALVGAGADSAHGIEQLHEPVIGAARAYVNGWRLMRAGAFDSAMVAFASSATQAPSFSEAELWSAQMGAWRSPRDPSSWHKAAHRATAGAHSLPGVDSLLAAGVAYLSEAAPPLACAAYRAAIEREPGSFVALYGLGQCQHYDNVVVRDRRIRGGLRFRSSHWSAVRAYTDALERVPTGAMSVLFTPVVNITYASGNTGRLGKGADGTRFIGMPSFAGDSVQLLPRSAIAVSGGSEVSETFSLALVRARAELRDFSERWVVRAPNSSVAWFQRAYALELTGAFDGPDLHSSAVRALFIADSLTRAPELHAQIQVARARVAIRRGSFEDATRIAHEEVSAETATPGVALLRAPLAAFLGDEERTRRFLDDAAHHANESERTRLDAWALNDLPPWLGDSVRALAVGAMLGRCEGLGARRDAIERNFVQYIAAARLAERRRSILREIYRAAVPCLGPSALRGFEPETPVDAAQAALDAGDAQRARQLMANLARQRRGMSTSTVTADVALAEVWVSLLASDTVTARARVHSSLTDLASISPFTFDLVPQAAALKRLKDLQVQLR